MARPAVAALLLVLATAAPAIAAPQDYQLTPTHSFVHFEWSHRGLSTLSGRFDVVRGQLRMDRAARSGGGLVTIRLDRVNTGRPALDAALRQALDADGGEAPSTFRIDGLRFAGDAPAAAQGHWSWRGRELDLTLQAVHFNCYLNPLLRREVCGGDFEATVDPAAIGVALPASFGLQGPIRLRVQVEAIRQEPGEPQEPQEAGS
ncbi:MAG: YceI family protein [Proteobacteria bacterium]|nr:YceI family protein [Pseudomonadota bacterium]